MECGCWDAVAGVTVSASLGEMSLNTVISWSLINEPLRATPNKYLRGERAASPLLGGGKWAGFWDFGVRSNPSEASLVPNCSPTQGQTSSLVFSIDGAHQQSMGGL